MIQTLFSGDVITATADPGMWDGQLLPEEESCIRNVVAKRRREFTAGRLCARKALAAMGIEGFPLLTARDRTPIWPPGIVGSIAHCDGYCGVAVARRGAIVSVGLDVEGSDPLEPEAVRLICTSAERSRLTLVDGLDPGRHAKLLFSAKESVYKCWYPLERRLIDFTDVEVTLLPEESAFVARFLPGSGATAVLDTVRGRYALDSKRVYCGATLTSPEVHPSSSVG